MFANSIPSVWTQSSFLEITEEGNDLGRTPHSWDQSLVEVDQFLYPQPGGGRSSAESKSKE